MLSAKPWRLEAMIRFFLSVFICLYAGSLANTALRFAGGKAGFKFFVLAFAAFGFLAATFFLSRKPWTLQNVGWRLVLVLGCFYAGICLGAWAQTVARPAPATISTAQMLVGTLSFQGAAIVLTPWFLHQHQIDWAEGFGLKNNWRQALLFGVLAACLFL